MQMFAQRFGDPEGSPIRALFPYLNDPAIIGLAGGNPAPDLFDVEGLRNAMHEAMQSPATAWAQYCATQGLPELREALASRMRTSGSNIAPADLLVTAGSQQGFDLLTRVLVDPGDVMIVERPTYTTALQGLRQAGAHVWGVDGDHEGLDVDALERMLAGAKNRHRIKAVYVVPTFANPSGTSLSMERRVRLLQLAIKWNVLIIEDDPYSDLRYSGEPLPRIFDLTGYVPGSEKHAVYLSSLSKIMAPGLRIGWMAASPDLLKRCAIAKQTVDLCSSTWTQAAAARYISGGYLEPHIERARTAYAERASAMIEAMQTQLAGRFSFAPPSGGMFVWGRFTDGLDTRKLLAHAIDAGVVFVPGAAFYSENGDPSTARFCFSMCAPARIKEGIGRLRTAMDSYRHSEIAASARLSAV
jgi:DNA-binding transcriptional MocR family regulator